MATSVETFEELRKDIISGRYPPMHLLDPRELSSEYLMSVAPIREAMLRLSERGLLRWERNRGFFVNKISSTSALFYLDQLRSAYVNAIRRLKERGGRTEKFESLFDTSGDDFDGYASWYAKLETVIFCAGERDFVAGIWDRIWIYRNQYLMDEENRNYFCQFSRKATTMLSMQDYEGCIGLVDDKFQHMIGRLPKIISNMNV